jgi:hypothetical protein
LGGKLRSHVGKTHMLFIPLVIPYFTI